MKLYHGSNVKVDAPEIKTIGFYKDFGYGFYCTAIEKQACRWALTKRPEHVVSVYEYTPDETLKVYSFPAMSEEWLDFVVANRRFAPLHDYDIVLGPVANDNLYATISLYENGELSAEAAVVQLKTHVLFNQVSFHTDKALSQLRFVGAMIVD